MDFTTAIGIGKALGGLFGKKKKGPSIEEQYRMQRDHHRLMPGVTRDGYERAGFNPLLGVQGGASIPFQPSLIGDSHSTAGGIFAQGLDMVHDGLLQKTQLAQENEKLRETIDDLAKPSQPSHMDSYGDTIPLPSNGEMNAVPESIFSSDVGSGGSDGGSADFERPPARLRAFGLPVTGTGLFEKGEINEQELGEPGGWLLAPFVVGDAIIGTAANMVLDQKVERDMRRLERLRNPTVVKTSRRPSSRRPRDRRWGNSPPRSIAPTQREIDNHSFRRRALFGG